MERDFKERREVYSNEIENFWRRQTDDEDIFSKEKL